MARCRLMAAAMLALCWSGMALAQDPMAAVHSEQLGFAPDRLQKLTDAYKGYVDRGELPGAVLLIACGDQIAYAEAIGFPCVLRDAGCAGSRG